MKRTLTVLFILLCCEGRASESVYSVDYTTDGFIAGGAVLAGVLPYAYASKLITPRCPCNPQEVNGFDRSAIGNNSYSALVVSDITVISSMLAPLALDLWDLGPTEAFWQDTFVFAQALAVSGALVSMTKHAFPRPLPRAYAGQSADLNSVGEYRSFYSGHATIAFTALSATAMTLSLRYGTGMWPWIMTGVVGSTVALERVLGGVHFYSDVIVGAVVGTGVGILIPWLHSKEPLSAEKGMVTVVPRIGGAELLFIRRL